MTDKFGMSWLAAYDPLLGITRPQFEHARRVAGSVAERVASMTDGERLAFWEAVKEGYCAGCGRKLTQHNDACHCQNDD